MSPAPSSSGSNPLTRLYVVLGVVALLGIGFMAYQVMGGGGQAAREPVPVVLDPQQLNRVQGIAIGREDAPIQIWEFADFQCGACAGFAAFIAPLIKERLVDTGRARYVYYDFPLVEIHPNAFLAARAGRCANEQGRFWEMHDHLYGQQGSWANLADPTDRFVELAERAGLDTGAFRECLLSDRYAQEVSENRQLGLSLGVDATPTLIVNGQRVAAPRSYSELEKQIDQIVGSGATPQTPAPDSAEGGVAVPAESIAPR